MNSARPPDGARRPVRRDREPRPPGGDHRARARSCSSPGWTRPDCARGSARHPPPARAGARGGPWPTATAWSTRSPTTRSATARSRSCSRDDTVTEIMVNGPHDVWVERDGHLLEHAACGSSTSRTCAGSSTRSSAQIGRRIDESSPMVDARLPDGSRVNAVISPLSLSGPLVTIRKFSQAAADPQRPRPARDASVPRPWTSSSAASERSSTSSSPAGREPARRRC